MGIALSLLALGSAAAAEPPACGCTGRLSASQRLICADAELAAYDRAVTLLSRRARSDEAPGRAGRRAFRRERNACGEDRGCILSAYRRWLDDYGWGILFRSDDRPYSRGLEAPAVLHLVPLGGEWYLFSAGASDSNTSAARPSSYAGGVLRLSGGTGRFAEQRNAALCAVELTKRSEREWQVVDNGGCGILPMTGTYRPYGW